MQAGCLPVKASLGHMVLILFLQVQVKYILPNLQDLIGQIEEGRTLNAVAEIEKEKSPFFACLKKTVYLSAMTSLEFQEGYMG